MNWWDEMATEMKSVLSRLNVGIYGGGGAPYHHAALVALWGGRPVMVDGEHIKAGALRQVDVMVFPGGGIRAMEGLLEPLGIEGAAELRRWVADGGMYIGTCAGSFLPACVGQAYWNAHPEARELCMVPAVLANSGESEPEALISPGVGVLQVEVTVPEHWLAQGLPQRFDVVHYNGPMFLVDEQAGVPRHEAEPTKPEGVVRFTGRTANFTPSEAFMNHAYSGGTLFDSCVQRGAYSAITAQYGSGAVVLFGSHPEFGFDAMQLGWGISSRLFANALRHQATNRRGSSPGQTVKAASSASGAALAEAATTASAKLAGLSGRFDALAHAAHKEWLIPGEAPGFLGHSAEELWRESLSRAAEVSAAAARYLKRLTAESDSAAFAAVHKWIDHEARPGQDYGFVGLKQLVETLEQVVSRGEAKLHQPPFQMKHAYDGFFDHPYLLLAATYLSASGLVSSAALSCAVIGRLIGHDDEPPVGPL